MSMTKPRLTWSRQPDETGLARVCQPPRGAILKANGKEVAYVSPVLGWPNRHILGWYFVGMGQNSYNDPDGTGVFPTMNEAKAACKAYIVGQLAKGTTP